MPAENIPQPYSHPPIVEVLVEVRLVSEVSTAKLKKVHDRIAGKYSNSKMEVQTEAKVDFAARSATFVDKPPIFQLSTADQTDLCVLSVLSFAWLRRAPYEGWEPFRDRISGQLAVALKAAGAPKIGRLGLRYVNRIDVEFKDGLAHYEDYLNFRILHGELLEPTQGFQWHLVKEFSDLGLKANVQSAVVDQEIPGMGAFTFDIDVYTEIDVPQLADDILTKLEAMRTLKNSIFEAGVTDYARKQYR